MVVPISARPVTNNGDGLTECVTGARSVSGGLSLTGVTGCPPDLVGQDGPGGKKLNHIF